MIFMTPPEFEASMTLKIFKLIEICFVSKADHFLLDSNQVILLDSRSVQLLR